MSVKTDTKPNSVADGSSPASTVKVARTPKQIRLTQTRFWQWGGRIALWVLLTVLILLPRSTTLRTFLTADEDDQLFFSAQFLVAVLNQDWAGALVLGYPGVPTMGLGSLGLWLGHQAQLQEWNLPFYNFEAIQANALLGKVGETTPVADLGTYLALVQAIPLNYIEAVRLPMALAATLSVLLMFVMLGRLFSKPLALAATLLIAFDPFLLAHSRVIHVDAPLTYFMFAAFIAFILYLSQGRWPWLILSGVLGALGVLSKTPGILIGPILVMGGLFYTLAPPSGNTRKQQFKRLIVALFIWTIIAGAAFFALWPSMWARPMFALEWITNNILSVSKSYHPSSGVFWGPYDGDKNPLYYLFVVPFHLTPLASLGILVSLPIVGKGLYDRWSKKDTFSAQQLALLLSLLAYAIFFVVIISYIPKRIDRYTLPIFPALSLLTSISLYGLISSFLRRSRWQDALAPSLLLAVVVLQAVLVTLYHPYYLAYFNPLLGGNQAASRYITIGWGEGLDEAAAYLNQKPQANELAVAAWYSWQFAPFFEGETIDLASNEPAYEADYVVFYLNQIQRNLPSFDLMHYFKDREPEAVINLHGLDYVWIYPGPIFGSEIPETRYPLNVLFENSILLAGLDLVEKTLPSDIQNIPVTLYWQGLDDLTQDYNVAIRIVDDRGSVWGEVDRLPLGGLVRTTAWQPGTVVRDDYKIALNPATPPGTYTFDILLYDFKTGEVFGQVKRVGAVNITPARQSLPPAALQETIPAKLAFQLTPNLELIGHDLTLATFLPGKPEYLKLYWYAQGQLNQDYAVRFLAQHSTGEEIIFTSQAIGPDLYPTSQWPRGQVLAGLYQIAFPANAPAGQYTLFVLNDTATERVELGQALLPDLPRIRDLPNAEQITPLNAHFNGDVSLVGYELVENERDFDLTLYWQAVDTPATDYSVFIHLSQADESIVAQRDSVPENGTRPTTSWLPGEFIVDHYNLPLPTEPGEHTLWLGLYNPQTLERLPIISDHPTSLNRLQLTMLK